MKEIAENNVKSMWFALMILHMYSHALLAMEPDVLVKLLPNVTMVFVELVWHTIQKLLVCVILCHLFHVKQLNSRPDSML